MRLKFLAAVAAFLFATAIACKTPARDARLHDAAAAEGSYALAGYLAESPDARRFVVVRGDAIAAILDDRAKVPEDIPVLETGGFILPGLIDLHAHLPYHVLPLWDEAHGQFESRFEWRSRKGAKERYNAAVAGEMAPYKSTLMQCVATRFGELRALTGGVTTIQGGPVAVRGEHGFVECASPFATRNVEAKDEIVPGKAVKTQLDTVSPYDLKFFKSSIEPKMGELGGYDKALDAARTAPGADAYLTEFEAGRRATIDGLRDQSLSAVITHLAEGRRDDPFTRSEFTYLKMFGLDLKGLVMIHALGLSSDELRHAAERGMHIVWSPVSNLMLYGQTLDVAAVVRAATQAGVPLNLSLGADWGPSGSRHVLDELKIARRYLDRAGIALDNQALMDMVTKNPARALGAEGRLGVVAAGAQADLLVLPRLAKQAADTLLAATERDVGLVVIAGRAVYGKRQWVQELAGEDRIEPAAPVGADCPGDVAFRLGPAGSLEDGLAVGSSRVDLQACKLEYSIVSPK